MIDLDISYSKAQIQVFFPETNYARFTVVRKGRRVGLTRGAAQAFIEYGLDQDFWFLPKGDIFLMWADTVSSNIDRYYDRYFHPILKKLPQHLWKWRSTERILKIGRATIDFRSADRPENWEGFGYHIIFLNEAGIILEDDYLYDNAVLPMLMDFPNTKLIAAGVPKGKKTKNGVHKFYKIYEESLRDKVNYRNFVFTSYANPFINKEAIDVIAATYDDLTKAQEINGEFVDLTEKPFLYAFDRTKHEISRYEPNEHLPITVSFDFNKDPITSVIGQRVDIITFVCFDEMKIQNGSTPELCEMIIAKYPHWVQSGQITITGDATGQNRSPLVRGGLNHYMIIKKALKLKDSQILVRASNLSHKNSRVLCNSVLQNAQFYLTESCKETINDCIYAEVDETGELIKTAKEGRHFFDNVRYLIDSQFPDFIENPKKYRQ